MNKYHSGYFPGPKTPCLARVGVLMDGLPAADEQSDRDLAAIQMQTVLELQAIQKTLVEL